MNTFERHRQYLLRKQRKRRLLRHAMQAAASVAAFFAVWSLIARVGPPQYAPPAPGALGVLAAKEAAQSAVVSINTVHAELLPGFREDAKKTVLRLFDGSAQTNSQVDGTRRSEMPSGLLPTAPVNLPPNSPDTFSHAVLPSALRFAVQENEDDVLRNLPTTSARTLDILLVGIDSRLGHDRGRADALHLLTVDFNAPSIRITSIPRGTYSELGYKNEASNIISNVRAARGRQELQRRIGRMCQRDSVPYFVEIGFSDAYGILELLGFENPGAELQALRQRKGYQFGDHNRCYNQGLFIRSAILRLLPILEGATGELLMSAGLDLVHTNLTAEQCRGIVYLLNDAGVGHAPSLINVTLRSRFRKSIERDAPDPAAMHAVTGSDYVGKGGKSDAAELRIREALAAADAHRGDARRVRAMLWTVFTQHAWLQLEAGETRRVLRDSLAGHLIEACSHLQDDNSVMVIRRALRADNLLFSRPSESSLKPSSVMRP
ncbi:MAG: hypothetical protein WBQ23_15370 [Bacteroidota bacterium]